MSADARRQLILTGPILPTLARLTLPVITVIIAQTFVAVLEAYWVSRLGTAAVAGVALVLPLFVLMGTMSNGGIGGGVSAAIARAIGAGRHDDAQALLWHALLIAAGFGLAFTFAALAGGPLLYRALGGHDDTLAAALAFSNWMFGGALVIWLVNLAGSALRGAGEVRLPALVNLAGAAVLVPLSPVLIFGIGPLPGFGVAGAGIATLLYYLGALVVLLLALRRGIGGLRLAHHPYDPAQVRAIMGVGLASAVGTLLASLTIVAITGSVGQYGQQALAGYGIASRVDSLLVPLLFGLGTGVVTMVSAARGAGQLARAWRVTWVAAGMACAATTAIGLLLALVPGLWMDWFSSDPAVRATGARWFALVGPAYGLFGLGLMLYFAAQGWGQMQGALVAGIVRLAVTAGGAALAAASGAPLPVLFGCATAGLVLFGLINAGAVWRLRPGGR